MLQHLHEMMKSSLSPHLPCSQVHKLHVKHHINSKHYLLDSISTSRSDLETHLCIYLPPLSKTNDRFLNYSKWRKKPLIELIGILMSCFVNDTCTVDLVNCDPRACRNSSWSFSDAVFISFLPLFRLLLWASLDNVSYLLTPSTIWLISIHNEASLIQSLQVLLRGLCNEGTN